jgi:hypothetical protein
LVTHILYDNVSPLMGGQPGIQAIRWLRLGYKIRIKIRIKTKKAKAIKKYVHVYFVVNTLLTEVIDDASKKGRSGSVVGGSLSAGHGAHVRCPGVCRGRSERI